MEVLDKVIDKLYNALETAEPDLARGRKMNSEEAHYLQMIGHALKSFECVKAMREETDGESFGNRSYDGGASGRRGGMTSRDGGTSGRRGARRNAMGQYSRDGLDYDNEADEMIRKLDELKSMMQGR